MNYGTRGLLALLVVTLALVAGCGNGASSSDGHGGGGAVAGCLNPGEVREEVDRIAEGFETSSEEVEAKQEAIQSIEAEAC